MNTQEIIKRLKVMLSLEDDKKVDQEMKSLATLIDGTEVFVMDGEIAVGSILNIVTEGEEQMLAPEGMHETTDGMLVTVGEAGEILSVEPKETQVEAGYDKDKEEKMEEVAVEAPEGLEGPTEDFLQGMAELLQPFIEEVKELTEEFKKIKARFEAVADQPATGKIKTKMSKTKEDLSDVENKIEILKKIRRGNK
jgi:hypothetical protein